MNANATVAAIAVKIVMVNAVVKRGEKVFNAYMIVSIRFELLLVGLARLGCSLSALLLSIVTNGGIAQSRYACTIRTQNKGVKFFFKFFFVGCGRVGVGARVWVLGSVGAWVWVLGWGGGMGMGGRGMRRAGLGWSLSDSANRPPVLTQPGFGLAARV